VQVAADNTNALTGNCPAPGSSDNVDPAIIDCYSEFLPNETYLGRAGFGRMHFRVTVRDNHPGAGGLGHAGTTVRVEKTAGPFRVTSQATPKTYFQTASDTGEIAVTWDAARTTLAPINTANVKITLSTDGGRTFSHVLAASTPNDGSQTVPLPRVSTEDGRIKVEAVGNVFFDISHAPIRIGMPSKLTAPSSVNLGTVEVGRIGTTHTLTIANRANSIPVHLGTLTLGGADKPAIVGYDDGCSGKVLGGGESCQMSMRLAPEHTGDQLATITIPNSAEAGTLVVKLTGKGT
jgi:hypothetical protein